jgi:apolipoprotein N-acyltransferase
MLCNFWLGTFSLVSLQFITVYYFILYLLFMVCALWIVKRNTNLMFITFPALWVIFDYLRSQGFMGYPWAFLGSSQYTFLPLIQISSITGIWGVTFVLILANTTISEVASSLVTRSPIRPIPVLFFTGCFVGSILFGEAALFFEKRRPIADTAVVALIQQNTDPRKHNYRESFNRLKELTDAAMEASSAGRGRNGPAPGRTGMHTGTPDLVAGTARADNKSHHFASETANVDNPRIDLVAWSETAFVPNIRKWGAMDPSEHSYAALVRDLLDYQKSLDTWLLTGNDDYVTIETETGEQRFDYNASILFSEDGQRMQTYHKLHLVPFTEYFPYREQFPGFYNMLLNFDVNLWEPGSDVVVFEHPKFTFCTPICFEDSFPADVRTFVRHGAEVILNLSNDFWSLQEAEATQHFANSIFRAVENRRPLLRSTASGVTAYVDTAGRRRDSLPLYEEGFLVVEVSLPSPRTTVYTWLGDWFPFALMVLLLVLPVGYYYVFIRDKALQ